MYYLISQNLSPGPVKTQIVGKHEVVEEEAVRVPRIEAKDIADSVIYVLGTPQSVEVG